MSEVKIENEKKNKLNTTQWIITGVCIIGIVYELAFLIDCIDLEALRKFPLLYVIDYELGNRMDSNIGLSIMYLLRLVVLSAIYYVSRDNRALRIKIKLLISTRILIILTILAYELCLLYLFRFNGKVFTLDLHELNNVQHIIMTILLIVESILYILLIITTRKRIRLILILGFCASILLPVMVTVRPTFLLLHSFGVVRFVYYLHPVFYVVNYILAISLIRNYKDTAIENKAET